MKVTLSGSGRRLGALRCNHKRAVRSWSVSVVLPNMLSILVSILVPATAREAPPVRIMPFGDSLTIFDCRLNAFTSADDEPLFQPLARIPASSIYPQGTFFVVAPGGYRGHLASLMGDPSLYPANVQALPAWSYVGREYLCGAHEGYPGATIEWLGEHVATPAVASAQPDIVLFLGGTNDFFWSPPKGSRSPLEVADRLRRLLNASVAGAASVGAASPTFLLGTVTPVNMTRCRLYHTARWHPGGTYYARLERGTAVFDYMKSLPPLLTGSPWGSSRAARRLPRRHEWQHPRLQPLAARPGCRAEDSWARCAASPASDELCSRGSVDLGHSLQLERL